MGGRNQALEPAGKEQIQQMILKMTCRYHFISFKCIQIICPNDHLSFNPTFEHAEAEDDDLQLMYLLQYQVYKQKLTSCIWKIHNINVFNDN